MASPSSQVAIWLRPNPRAIVPSAVVLGVLILLTAALTVVCWLLHANTLITVFTVAALLGLQTVFLVMLYWARLPRLASDGRHLLVFLEGMQPRRVPLDLVECFFRGETEAALPGTKAREAKTASIVVRLAERATDWQKCEVRPSLGHWCGGYITILGTWCEPITADLLRDLNARLTAAHRALREAPSKEPAHGAAIGQRS